MLSNKSEIQDIKIKNLKSRKKNEAEREKERDKPQKSNKYTNCRFINSRVEARRQRNNCFKLLKEYHYKH